MHASCLWARLWPSSRHPPPPPRATKSCNYCRHGGISYKSHKNRTHHHITKACLSIVGRRNFYERSESWGPQSLRKNAWKLQAQRTKNNHREKTTEFWAVWFVPDTRTLSLGAHVAPRANDHGKINKLCTLWAGARTGTLRDPAQPYVDTLGSHADCTGTLWASRTKRFT